MDRDSSRTEPPIQKALDVALGYLNFSSGSADRAVLRALNELIRRIEPCEDCSEDTVAVLHRWLDARLTELHSEQGPFADAEQVQSVLSLWWDEVVPGYAEFHKDLLFQQSRASLWRPFFVGRAWEAILVQGPPWEETARIRQGAIEELNDYVGFRPVAVLEGRACEPYAHERVGPIPLYIVDVGVGCGPYEELIATALQVLRDSDSHLLHDAWFDWSSLKELVLDPRPYDFDHPVNRRPAYHFGQWDPHRIDNRGQYCRFVLQRVALDALLERVEQADNATRQEWMFEAGAVLAGTMLMASGLCGTGPGCHDSDVILATLLPHIAGYRDQFYVALLSRLTGERGERLRREAEHLHQSFGGARQHLNQQLARRRAMQLQKAHLAVLCARMGYPDAANRHSDAVQISSARIMSRIHCYLTAAHDAIDQGHLDGVPERIDQIEDRLHRGIECGALVDPWNIVGFSGNFGIFSALEDSVHDFRVEKLIELVEQVLGLCARAWSASAARDDSELEGKFSASLERIAAWWDTYATTSVESVPRLVGKEVEVSANLVAGALNSWHKAGAAAGDIRFWQLFIDQFDSPTAFQLVLEALLEQGDCIASRALLMQWVSQADRIPLDAGESSLHLLARQWLDLALKQGSDDQDGWWPLVRRFVELLEANAEDYWRVPTLELEGNGRHAGQKAENNSNPEQMEDVEEEEEEEPDDEGIFSAAYEDVVFRDSTDDGIDDSMLGMGADDSDFELENESQRLTDRLRFLATVADLWKRVAIAVSGSPEGPDEEQKGCFQQWLGQATENYGQLTELLQATHAYPISAKSQTPQELFEYDRRRLLKDSLLEEVVATCVETADAARLLTAVCREDSPARPVSEATSLWEAFGVLRGLLTGDREAIHRAWPQMTEWLAEQGLLYVPLSRGGDPTEVIHAKSRQQLIHQLLQWLPRLGMIQETCELLALAHAMELDHPVGHGAVTEFDRLFKSGYLAMVRCLVESSTHWQTDGGGLVSSLDSNDTRLFEGLQRLTELQLHVWLEHSRTLRLSVVEKVAEDEAWNCFVAFIQEYGQDLLTQSFLGMSNIRAILHKGVERWLEAAQNELYNESAPKLIEQFEYKIDRREAVTWLSLALEAVAENYGEYRDYNATTTQSDKGDMLFAFIDFLRLRNEYDRIAWNLRPVALAHDVLARRGRTAVAAEWRAALTVRTAEAADDFANRHSELCSKYGMRLPTIAGRLAERFTRPLDVGRIRALVGPAVREALDGDSAVSFSVLEHEIEQLASQPCGAGMDVPDWLEALEDEVDRARSSLNSVDCDHERGPVIPQVCISWSEFCRQLEQAEEALG